MAHFSSKLRQYSQKINPQQPSSFNYLLPCPQKGSACKRLNMYFRWVVRPDDGIDLGVWKKVKPSSLIMPVDTHIAQIAQVLGLSKRNAIDWRLAEELTGVLGTVAPEDPVKFDFSLCRFGMTTFRGLK